MALSKLTRLLNGYAEEWTPGDAIGGIREKYICVKSDAATCRADLLDANHSDVNANVNAGDTSSTYSTLYCRGVGVEHLPTVRGTGGGPDRAVLTAQYRNRDYQAVSWPVTTANDIANWTESWQGGAQALTVKGGFKFVTDNSDISTDNKHAQILFPEATVVISGKTDALNSAAKTKILNCIGKVNGSAFTIKGHTYAAEHLLFEGADLDQEESDNYVLSYRFMYRHDNTWNELYRDSKDGGPGFEAVVASDGGTPYQTAAFSDLDPVNW